MKMPGVVGIMNIIVAFGVMALVGIFLTLAISATSIHTGTVTGAAAINGKAEK